MRNSRRGFTLLELLLVVSMMGIIAAMAVPRIRTGSDRANLSAARDVVATYASNARRAAISRSQTTRLRISNDTVRVLMDVTAAGSDVVAPPIVLSGQYRSSITLDGLATGDIVFDKRGLIRGNGASRKLLLTNLDGVRDSVCISGAGLVMRGTCR